MTLSNGKTDYPAKPKRPKTALAKALSFRFLAICVGLLPFAIIEFVLIVVGWQPSPTNDLSISFTGDYPLFVKADSENRFEIAENRLQFFRPASFAFEKDGSDPNRKTIFVVGGSTVQGRPWETQTAFPAWLEIMLRESAPRTNWQVVNCGGVSYASYRLKFIVAELVRFDPDLIIVCTGHNEFLEERSYGTVKKNAVWLAQAHQVLSNSRSYQFARSCFAINSARTAFDGKEVVDSNEPITKLDFQRGMDRFIEDRNFNNQVEIQFEKSLQQMAEVCIQNDVRLLFVAPAANQKDCPPFKSESAQQAYSNGTQRFESHSYDDAKVELNRAIDLDICSLRMTSNLRARMIAVCEQKEIPFLDLQASFEDASTHSITGEKWFVDHVHPNIQGHQLIASELFDVVRLQETLGELKAIEEVQLEKPFQKQIESLDYGYFQRGRDRLDAVMKWARGDAINALPAK